MFFVDIDINIYTYAVFLFRSTAFIFLELWDIKVLILTQMSMILGL